MKIFNRKIDFRFYSLALILCFPILKFNFTSMFIGVFACASLGSFFFLREKLQKEYVKYFFISASFVLLLIITLIYSDNLESGFRVIQHGLSIIIFPILIFFF